MMGRPELGTKCTCTGCSERFYDLNRALAVCPKCGAEQAPQKARTLWPSRGAAGAKRSYRPPEAAVAEEDPAPMTAVEETDEEDEAVDADADEDDAEVGIDPDHDT
jgi:uncharacterized protein (TIGR02300 family)